MNLSQPLAIFLAAFLLIPAGVTDSFSQNVNDDIIIPNDSSIDLIPDDDTVGPVARVSDEYKFDDGFYTKIQDLMGKIPTDGDIGVHDDLPYYNVIIVVSRDDGDDRDPDETAKENKGAIVKRLKLLGAQDIKSAESLSFVTASIPIVEIPGFSLHDEIYRLGDGELPVTLTTDTARRTIHATTADLSQDDGSVPDGSGVVVGVVDLGINHVRLNDKVTDRIYCPNGCTVSNGIITGIDSRLASESAYFNSPSSTHGTQVAGVLAASGMAANNGIAQGVTLLDAALGDGLDHTNFLTNLTHSIDWSFSNGADIINISVGVDDCVTSNTTTFNLILNEAVDKGMVVVHAAGNSGLPPNNIPTYKSITNSGCSHNTITVGGVNDRNPDTTMYTKSSRGPVPSTHVLKPEIVAPAYNIQTLSFTTNDITKPRSGTSLAAPQVSATAAMLLQLEPEFTPTEIKASLLLGANWTGPIPCTSTQYEKNNRNDNCSYARQPTNFQAANNAASLGILNNVGFGILDTAQTLDYAHSRNSTHNHIMGDYLDTSTTSKKYTFSVTDTSKPVKVILTWLVQPHGSITEQLSRSTSVNVANLDFKIKPPSGSVLNANSAYQTNEFIVFNPTQTGTYTITVSGTNLNNLNKPVQNYAIASTLSLAPNTTFTNSAPIAQAKSVIINPTQTEPTAIRLTGTDINSDSISFAISTKLTRGTVTTDEFITKTTSRVLYTPSDTFRTRDTFTVTPQDGLATGTPVTITINAESLPRGSTNVSPRSSDVSDWETFFLASGLVDESFSHKFTGKPYLISALHVGSVNMEGVKLTFTTSTGTYNIAIPSSGARMIEFASPITILSAKLSADGLDEETPYLINRGTSHDIRMFVGYVPKHSCSTSPTYGASGAASSVCLAPTYSATIQSGDKIPDRTRSQSVSSTINVKNTGTISAISVSVDITHTYIGDLKVYLTSPTGTRVVLHSNTGGGTDNIKKTYTTSTTSGLASLVRSNAQGNWILSVGDYLGGDVGKLNSWGISITNPTPTPPKTPTPPTITPPPTTTPTSTTILSENFESSLTRWTETGEGDWRISTSQQHSAPTLTGHSPSNRVLHSDDCDTSCTLTLKNSIDLTQYSSASLSFWRFIDVGLDRDEYLKVELYNGHRWNTIYHWSDNLGGDDNIWHSQSFNLAAYLQASNFKIRFVTQESYFNEDVQIDNVVISGTRSSSTTPTTTPPATTPSNFSVYVADTDDREVIVYSDAGRYLGTFVESRSGGLGKVWDISFGPDGNLYASDNSYSKIRKYNGVTGAAISPSSGFASTDGYAYGLTWHGNTLYVATAAGIERFSLSGTTLGIFGDASRTPSNSRVPILLNAYDVEFCPDNRMYVSDRSANKVLYYSASTGSYLGQISGDATNPPNTRRVSGLECDSTYLYHSGDDGGRVNKIRLSTGSQVQEIRSNIDEPYTMDRDSAGNIYVANKDDDNIVKIVSNGTSTVFATGNLDDPRGIAIGPRYIAASGSAGSGLGSATGTADASNDGPEFNLLHNGTLVFGQTSLDTTQTTFTIQATDSESDAITLGVAPDSLPLSALSVTDHGNGAATLLVNSTNMTSGTYVFWVTASDVDNFDREPYAVIIP